MTATKKTPARKHNLGLTKVQFLALMKAVFIANWIANGTSSEGRRREFDDIEDIVFSYAWTFGYGPYTETKTTADGRNYPTDEFENDTKVHDILDEYDDDIFWENLVSRLAWRDFVAAYGQELINQMTPSERADKLSAFEDRYNREVEEHGIDRLKVPSSSSPHRRRMEN
jgi:hypothetical protein